MKKNAERFARSDLDLSDCEKEHTHYVRIIIFTCRIIAEECVRWHWHL